MDKLINRSVEFPAQEAAAVATVCRRLARGWRGPALLLCRHYFGKPEDVRLSGGRLAFASRVLGFYADEMAYSLDDFREDLEGVAPEALELFARASFRARAGLWRQEAQALAAYVRGV